MLRTPTVEEQERMHGFPTGYTLLSPTNGITSTTLTENERKSLLGNSFSCIAVAAMLGAWAVNEGILQTEPSIEALWDKAKSQEPSLPVKCSLSQSEDAAYLLKPDFTVAPCVDDETDGCAATEEESHYDLKLSVDSGKEILQTIESVTDVFAGQAAAYDRMEGELAQLGKVHAGAAMDVSQALHRLRLIDEETIVIEEQINAIASHTLSNELL